MTSSRARKVRNRQWIGRGRLFALIALLWWMAPVALVAEGEEKAARPFGYTGGEMAVNESGAATYSIPITVPAGSAGMAPKLALTYSSQAGNRLLGSGFNLSGLSVISRCPATHAQDGQAGGVRFDPQDRFCLDGERLMAIAGQDGEDGTEYRTEQDTFRRVFSHGSAGSGPAWWTVETRAGLRFEYGTSDASRIEAPGRDEAVFWNVHRAVDSLGNYWQADYFEDPATGESRPSLIRYTGNEAMDLEPYASVEFLYEERPDRRSRYLAGSTFEVGKRLSEIVVRDGDAQYRRYHLDYENGSSAASRLVSLTECGSDGTCIEPTTFEWTDGTERFEAEMATGQLDYGIAGGGWNRWVVDMTGDGLVDYVYMRNLTRELYIRENLGGVFGPNIRWGSLAYGYSASRLSFADVDSDGFTDFVYLRAGTRELWVMRNVNGEDFAPDQKWGQALYSDASVNHRWIADVNGDGYTDYVYLRYATRDYWWKEGSASGWGADRLLGTSPRNHSETWFQDMDGDALPDLYYRVGHDFYVMRSDGQQLGAEESWGRRDYSHTVHWNSDMDGDGLSDYVYLRWPTWKLYLKRNTGLGLAADALIGELVGGASASSEIWLADATGDGMLDVVYEQRSPLEPYVVPFDGQTLGEKQRWGSFQTLRHVHYNWIVDITGDGKVDYFFMHYPSYRDYVLPNGGEVPDLISGIREGNGRTYAIEHRPLTDESVYDKGSGAEFPEIDFQAPIQVVSSYSVATAEGETRSYRHTYGGAQLSLEGRGFRGFLENTIVDERAGRRTHIFYERDYRCISAKVRRTEERLLDGTLLLETDNEIEVREHGPGVHFSFVKESTTRRFDHEGNSLGEIVTTADYDGNGNSILARVSHQDGWSETTVNTYDDDTDRWFLGRLIRAQVTYEAPGRPDIRRTAAFAYDPQTGLLVEEITEPEEIFLKLTKTYGHDGFGNVESTTESAIGESSRTTITRFDDRGRYAVEIENALGQVETLVHDRDGLVERIDANGLVTTWDRDGFGRATRQVEPDGSFQDTAYLWCEDGDGCLPGAAYRIEKKAPGQPDRTTYFDLGEREVGQKAVGFDGRSILRRTLYDEAGRVRSVSEPYYEGESALFTHYVYDAMGRLVEEQAPGNRTTRTDYDGLELQLTNMLGQQSQRRTDSRGRLVESTDSMAGRLLYRYDAAGNLIEVEDPYGNLTTMAYDALGRRVLLEDPDTGTTSYVFDAFGRMVRRIDALGHETLFGYDRLGRLIERTEAEGTSTWIYDGKPMGIGQLGTAVGPGGFREEHSFDSAGRLSITETHIGGQSFENRVAYDSFGRIDTRVYPTGLALRTIYNVHGHPSEVRRADGTKTYWLANAVNPRGQLESATLGNGLELDRYYDPATGLLEEVSAGSVQHLTFGYDRLGNLNTRSDHRRGLTEIFAYDDLRRLVRAQVLSGPQVTVTYDALGNIVSKSDVGTYFYGENGAGPHAVTSVAGEIDRTYSYDAAGQRIGGSGETVAYTSFGKPRRIEKGSAVSEFAYGPDRRRFRQVTSDGSGTTTRLYVGSDFERVETATGVQNLHYIRAGGEVVAVRVEESEATPRYLYLLRDHLTSVQMITDGEGGIVETLSYDAWGRRRDAGTWDQPDIGALFADGFESGDISAWGDGGGASNITAMLPRGFTGHEHLGAVGLIHMNGRVYDPVLGRFLTADPMVQAPDFSQSLNRYSYVLNNPLSATDPSGFFFKKLFKAIGNFFESVVKFVSKNLPLIITAGVGLITGGVLLPALLPSLGTSILGSVLSGAAMGFVTSFAGALLSGADLGTALSIGLKSAVIGGLSAGLTTAVGDLFGHATIWVGAKANAIQKALAHGVVQGIVTELRGGKFQHGFFSAAFTTLTAPLIDLFDSVMERALAAAVIGGTASELGGGKFANGAITAAFVRLFNDEWPPRRGGPADSSEDSFTPSGESQGEFPNLDLSNPFPIEPNPDTGGYDPLTPGAPGTWTDTPPASPPFGCSLVCEGGSGGDFRCQVECPIISF